MEKIEIMDNEIIERITKIPSKKIGENLPKISKKDSRLIHKEASDFRKKKFNEIIKKNDIQPVEESFIRTWLERYGSL